MGAASLSDFHPFDPQVLEEPWEFNRRLRAEAPVYRDPHTGIFLVSSYDAVLEAAANWQVFSNRFARNMAAPDPPEAVQEVARRGYPAVDTMLTADPPEQRRFRKLVNKAFVPRRVKGLEPHVEALSHELIDAFEGDGRVELQARYARPLPLTVIAEQLGVPRSELPRFRRWSDGFVAQLGQMADEAGQVEAARLIVEFQHDMAKRLEERKASPRDDILSDIANAEVEGERPLDTAESLSILQQLLVAGNETTASAIGEGVLLLLRHPDELARVQADPSRVPALVEEVLRLATPTANMWRVTTADTTLAGVDIPKDAFVLLRYASANRDESRFPDPDRLDTTRKNADEHLAFGHGIHFCLGAMLARVELAVAFRSLLERLGDLRLDPAAPPPRHVPNVLLRGLASLHLRFDRRRARPTRHTEEEAT